MSLSDFCTPLTRVKKDLMVRKSVQKLLKHWRNYEATVAMLRKTVKIRGSHSRWKQHWAGGGECFKAFWPGL